MFAIKEENGEPEYKRIEKFIDRGNEARERSNDNSVLASGVASVIMNKRDRDENSKSTKPRKRIAYIISSLKHPKEVEKLRNIYSCGFFLIGVYSDEKNRFTYLTEDKRIPEEKARELIKRDEDEAVGYGQHTRDAFQLADFFIDYDRNKTEKC